MHGQPATIHNPRDAKTYGIETIYQTLALADNLDAAANVFLDASCEHLRHPRRRRHGVRRPAR